VNKLPFDKHSLLFAPMEGVTDGPYRLAISRAFPEWDYFSTDFYRVPTVGNIQEKAILRHYGHGALEKKSLRDKTSYQILTSARAQTKQVVDIINRKDFAHLDLNLGCPSKKVNAHRGGAFLLSDIETLKPIIKTIRASFDKTFTVKIRIGYKDDKLFLDLLKMFEDEGVDAITLHARTRDQLYQGIADWSYIKKAVKACSIPVIGNGDIWTVEDIIRIYDECDPYAIMLGRGALKTPWLATTYYEHKDNPAFLSDEFLLEERKRGLDIYFYELEREYRKENVEDINILKRFKSFSRYLFDDFEDPETVRGRFLRSTSLNEFKDHLQRLI
jgi:tRNA-dihydrouridine synthase